MTSQEPSDSTWLRILATHFDARTNFWRHVRERLARIAVRLDKLDKEALQQSWPDGVVYSAGDPAVPCGVAHVTRPGRITLTLERVATNGRRLELSAPLELQVALPPSFVSKPGKDERKEKSK